MSATDETHETANPPSFRVTIFERLDTLTDSLATANRAAIAHNRELAKLRRAIVIGVFAIIFYLHTKGI